MDKRQKKEMLRKWREGERAAARAALPLAPDEFKAMFDGLDGELVREGCDHSRRLTKRWLEERGHDAAAVFAWLNEHGGYCDCEVLANVEQHVEEALRGSGM